MKYFRKQFSQINQQDEEFDFVPNQKKKITRGELSETAVVRSSAELLTTPADKPPAHYVGLNEKKLIIMNVLKVVENLVEKRKKPCLILNLEEVRNHDCLLLQSVLDDKKFNDLDVILQTPGGDIEGAFNIVKLLKKVSKKLNIIVPLYAKSAGTLICLGADNLLLNELSELGPLDTQIQEEQEGTIPKFISALNGFKALEQIQQHTLETLDIATKLIISRSGMKVSEAIHLANEFAGNTSGTLYNQLNPKKIGEYARALEIGERYGISILTRYMNWEKEKAETIVKQLVYDYPSHGFILDYAELKDMGLPVKELDEDVTKTVYLLRVLLLEEEQTIIELIEPDTKQTTKKTRSKSTLKAKESDEKMDSDKK